MRRMAGSLGIPLLLLVAGAAVQASDQPKQDQAKRPDGGHLASQAGGTEMAVYEATERPEQGGWSLRGAGRVALEDGRLVVADDQGGFQYLQRPVAGVFDATWVLEATLRVIDYRGGATRTGVYFSLIDGNREARVGITPTAVGLTDHDGTRWVGRAAAIAPQSKRCEYRVRRLKSGEVQLEIGGRVVDTLPYECLPPCDSAPAVQFGAFSGRTATKTAWKHIRLTTGEKIPLPGSKPDGPVEIGTEAQLFLDDYLIEQAEGVTRQVQQATRHPANPVFRPEKPWEGVRSDNAGAVLLFGTVIFDEQDSLFKMWYLGWQTDDAKVGWPCYATSRDGVRWDRPDLGLVSWKDSKRNNIFLEIPDPMNMVAYVSVMKDSHDPDPKRLYKAVVFAKHDVRVAPRIGQEPSREIEKQTRGVYLSSSPDGVHWTPFAENVAGIGFNELPNLLYDPGRDDYVLLDKLPSRDGRRSRSLSRSSDFQDWEPMQLILSPPSQWPQSDEIYDMPAFRYESVYVGLVRRYHNFRTGGDGTIDITLATSRDGLHWQFVDPSPEATFLPMGPPGSWDDGRIDISNGPPVDRDGREWIFYGGRDGNHAEPYTSAIGICEIRKHGFASMHAGPEGGTLTTAPLVVRGGTLTVNAAAKGGQVRVEVLDENHRVIQGYGTEECKALTGNELAWPVRWQQHPELPSGRPIRLRFHLTDADLFSFTVD